MNQYIVTWEMDVEAKTPEQAAQGAWRTMRIPDSTANVFNVVDGEGNSKKVDLQELLESS